MITYAQLTPSNRETKKYKMIFYDDNLKKIKTTHFGQKNSSDYTKHRSDTRKDNYINRHNNTRENWQNRKDNYINRHNNTRENWQNYTSAGSLALNILWNKTTVKASFEDYLKKFNLKRY